MSKICTICCKKKDLSCYYVARGNKDGRDNMCSDCQRKRKRVRNKNKTTTTKTTIKKWRF